MFTDTNLDVEASSRTCSIITGIPLEDVKRLQSKHEEIFNSLRDSLKKLSDLCKDEPKPYQKVLINGFFDTCFNFLSQISKLDVIITIITNQVIPTDDGSLKNLFEKIKKQELNEVNKNR